MCAAVMETSEYPARMKQVTRAKEHKSCTLSVGGLVQVLGRDFGCCNLPNSCLCFTPVVS